MSEHLNLDYLTHTKFVSQPELHPLEMTGRMILAAAALEDAHYGHGEDRLLQLYQHNEHTIRAEYKKTLGTVSDRFERIVINLSRTTLTIALEQGTPDWDGRMGLFVNKAVMSPKGNAHHAHVDDQKYAEEAFTKMSLAQYSFDLQAQLEDFKIILPDHSFFVEQ